MSDTRRGRWLTLPNRKVVFVGDQGELLLHPKHPELSPRPGRLDPERKYRVNVKGTQPQDLHTFEGQSQTDVLMKNSKGIVGIVPRNAVVDPMSDVSTPGESGYVHPYNVSSDDEGASASFRWDSPYADSIGYIVRVESIPNEKSIHGVSDGDEDDNNLERRVTLDLLTGPSTGFHDTVPADHLSEILHGFTPEEWKSYQNELRSSLTRRASSNPLKRTDNVGSIVYSHRDSSKPLRYLGHHPTTGRHLIELPTGELETRPVQEKFAPWSLIERDVSSGQKSALDPIESDIRRWLDRLEPRNSRLLEKWVSSNLSIEINQQARSDDGDINPSIYRLDRLIDSGVELRSSLTVVANVSVLADDEFGLSTGTNSDEPSSLTFLARGFSTFSLDPIEDGTTGTGDPRKPSVFVVLPPKTKIVPLWRLEPTRDSQRLVLIARSSVFRVERKRDEGDRTAVFLKLLGTLPTTD